MRLHHLKVVIDCNVDVNNVVVLVHWRHLKVLLCANIAKRHCQSFTVRINYLVVFVADCYGHDVASHAVHHLLVGVLSIGATVVHLLLRVVHLLHIVHLLILMILLLLVSATHD